MAEVKLQSSSQPSSKKNFRTVKQEEPLIVTRAPHIRSSSSVTGRMWTFVLALIPILLAAAIVSGMDTLRILFHSVAAALIFEFIGEKALRRSVRIWDGSAIYWGALFALSIPAGSPSFLIWIAMLPVILINKFHPNRFNAILFSVFALSFGYFSAPVIIDHPIVLAAIGVSGILLLFRRLIPWQSTLLFLPLIFAGGSPALVLFAAVFFVTDSVTSPLTFWGRAIFSFTALMLSSALVILINPYQGMMLGLLIANLFVPLIDRYVKIKPIGTLT